MIFPVRLKEYFQRPKFYCLTTRDKNYDCDILRGLGVKLSGPDTMVVFVYAGTAGRSLENLKENGLISLACADGATHESYQLKGKQLEVRPATAEEQEFIQQYLHDLDEMYVEYGGMTGGVIIDAVAHDPALALEFEVEEIFDQTPKVGTGKLMTSV